LGSPTTELRWHLTGLHSTATMAQLTGNLGQLVVPAALAVLRRPALAPAAAAHRRLNATGAVVAGIAVSHLPRVPA
jgi:hypothetical protein